VTANRDDEGMLAGRAPWEPRPRIDWSQGLKNGSAIPDIDAGALTHKGVIYEYVRTHPGTHVRAIGKHLSLANGDLQYHVLWLERHGFVKTRRSGFYRFVYPAKMFNEDEEVLLSLLAQETPRELLLHLASSPGSTQRDLARRLDNSQPTISWHMERLVEAGVAAKERTPRGFAYQVTADYDDITRFLKAYHPDAWERWGEKFEGARPAHGEEEGDARRPTMVAPSVRLIRSG